VHPIRTACAYCGVGCGILATPGPDRTVSIKGDPDHPANHGKLCSKGTHLGETVSLEGRLLAPMIGETEATWDEALDLVATRFRETIAEHGPDSVAFYVSGQLLTEDYYVANKLMKGFIGSANIDTNSRLCMASAVAAYVRAFGEDVVPCSYEDLDEADLILLVGSNTAWCHPVIWQRIEAARARRGTKLVVIDPRRTETAEGADLHLAIRPDGDTNLFEGLLAHMRRADALDAAFLADRVVAPEGFMERFDHGHDLWSVATACDVEPADLQILFELFEASPRTVTLFSQGVNQSRVGTGKANAIINLHLATGRIGTPGAGPFSITGQPNAMGGREVGGLASTLAAHRGFAEDDRAAVQDFWQSPAIPAGPGLKAVDLFEAVYDGRIKAIWIMATNPAVSMPDAGRVREALARCPFVVVSDVIADTDTGAFAHVRLPAAAWGEKDGTVTNSDRTITRQRAFFGLPGAARPDWWIVADVGRRMGFESAFAFASAAEVFREYCRQTAFGNDGARKLDLGFLGDVSDGDYDALEPVRWGGASPFADGLFPTPDRRARLVIPEVSSDAGAERPMLLNTGRYRDQWHTMTRSGLSPRLSRHRPEPLVEVHPDDAAAFGLTDGGFADIESDAGCSLFRVLVTAVQRRGEAFVPMHWTDRTSGAARTGRIPLPEVDPISGQPGFKRTPVTIRPREFAWRGFLVSRARPDLDGLPYWTLSRTAGGWLAELAGDELLDAVLMPEGGSLLEAVDSKRGTFRRAAIAADGRLAAASFVAKGGKLPGRDWIAAQLDEATAPAATALLAGRPATPAPDIGPIVCVCFDIGMKTILAAIADQGLASVAAVGAAIGAGTNCGSCRPAIGALIGKEGKVAHG